MNFVTSYLPFLNFCGSAFAFATQMVLQHFPVYLKVVVGSAVVVVLVVVGV